MLHFVNIPDLLKQPPRERFAFMASPRGRVVLLPDRYERHGGVQWYYAYTVTPEGPAALAWACLIGPGTVEIPKLSNLMGRPIGVELEADDARIVLYDPEAIAEVRDPDVLAIPTYLFTHVADRHGDQLWHEPLSRR